MSPLRSAQKPQARECAVRAAGAPVLGEGVQEGVGGGVVGLAGSAGDSGVGGEHDERGEFAVAGEFVQVPGGVGLGAQDPVDAVGGEVVQEAVVEDAGRVDHCGQGVFGGDAGEDAGQVVAVGGVAGDDLGIGAEGGEFLAQGVRSGGVGSAPAGEQQVPYAVTGDQVAGDVGAQDAGAAGDQDGAGAGSVAPGTGGGGPGGVVGVVGAHQAGHGDGARPDGELGLAGAGRRGHGADQGVGRGVRGLGFGVGVGG